MENNFVLNDESLWFFECLPIFENNTVISNVNNISKTSLRKVVDVTGAVSHMKMSFAA